MEKDLCGAVCLIMGLFAVSVLAITLLTRPRRMRPVPGNGIILRERPSDNEDDGTDRVQAAGL